MHSLISDADIIFKGNDGGSSITALTLNMSEAGQAQFTAGATFGAAITSNAGVVVDEMTLDGDTLTATDDFIINAAGDINLDADGGDIVLKDNGSTYGILTNTSNNLIIKSGSSTMLTGSGANASFSGTISSASSITASGAITAGGDITAFSGSSDINLKENIKTITGALDKIDQLTGIIFNYKKNGKKSTGLIAQDLQKVLPEVVYTSKDIDTEEEHLAVRYGNIAGLIIEAIKELKKEVETLKESK